MFSMESETQKKFYDEIGKKIDSRLTILANHSLNFETGGFSKSSFGSDDEDSFTQEVLFTNCDYLDEYESLIENISNDKSSPTKLEALHKLLDCPVIDVTDKRWCCLSKNLQYCLISTNDQVFGASIKMYFKIILLPESCCEGYVSLVQGLEMIFNSRCFLNKQHFLANNKLETRAVTIVKCLLKTENFVLRNLIQAKLGVFDEFLVVFFMLLSKSQESRLFEILGVLDSRARWFSNLCYSLQIRCSVLMKCFNVIKIAVSIFMRKNTVQNSSLKYKMEVCHAMHIILEVLKYEKGRNLFPIKLSSDSIGIKQLFFNALARIDETKCEIKDVLIEFLEKLSEHLDGDDAINALMEPFKNNMFSLKQSYQVVQENPHVIRIIKSLCDKKSANILHSYHKQKVLKHKNLYSMTSIGPLHIITNLTIACLRYFISISEKEHQVKEILIELLHCCRLLYAMHPVSFLICSPDKLICCIQDFHDVIFTYQVNLYYKLDLAEILGFFYSNHPTIFNTLKYNKTVLLNEIFNGASKQFLPLIPVIANDSEGYEVLKSSAVKITGPYLRKIWLEEDNIWEESFELVLNEFLALVQTIALNFKAFDAFITSDDELTLVDGDAKPTTITELLEAVFYSNEENVCVYYVVLRVIKVLLVNCDIAVFLDFTYKLQVVYKNTSIYFFFF